MAKASKKQEIIDIQEIEIEEIRFNVLGRTPLIMNRFHQKARQELLYPKERESRATLESRLKHDPLAEFRGSICLNRDANRPALIHLPDGAPKKALAAAGLDMPGAAKAKLERLTGAADINIDLFGVPMMYMVMVRNSDINRTPDVRTRAIFPQWACSVTFRYPGRLLTRRAIASLFGAAGVIVGIGDWRPQKGGSHGTFTLVSDDDPAFREIVKKQGRAAQKAAFDKPSYYDADTEELFAWFEAELVRREKSAPSRPSARVLDPDTGAVIAEKADSSRKRKSTNGSAHAN